MARIPSTRKFTKKKTPNATPDKNKTPNSTPVKKKKGC